MTMFAVDQQQKRNNKSDQLNGIAELGTYAAQVRDPNRKSCLEDSFSIFQNGGLL